MGSFLHSCLYSPINSQLLLLHKEAETVSRFQTDDSLGKNGEIELIGTKNLHVYTNKLQILSPINF